MRLSKSHIFFWNFALRIVLFCLLAFPEIVSVIPHNLFVLLCNFNSPKLMSELTTNLAGGFNLLFAFYWSF